MGLVSKFPSLDDLAKGAVDTFKRFPFALLSAMVGVVSFIYLMEAEMISKEHWLHNLLLTAGLGLPLFTALVTFTEKKGWKASRRLAFQAVGILLLALYYISLPKDITESQQDLVRFMVLNIGLHFLVAFAPFLGGQQVTAFWQFNKALFLRFLLAYLYSNVLYIGLAIALGSADKLFGFDVDGESYVELFAVIAGIFNTWVFLAGVPKDFNALSQTVEYPKGLKLFTQYILLPLVSLYFVILIAYEFKIIVEWNWPRGWVSNLVLWYSVVGILSLLLLHPLQELVDNKWIKNFSRWFFRALLPLLVMLMLAIIRRINDYGVTENRYFVLAMAIGLSIVVIYFIFSRVRDIRIIPIILFLIAMVAAYGPVSASNVSLRSQKGRLENLLIANGLFENGKKVLSASQPDAEQSRELSSVVKYMNEWHDIDNFRDWLPDSTIARLDTLKRRDRLEDIALEMGFAYTGYNYPGSSGYFSLYTEEVRQIELVDFEYLIIFKPDILPHKRELYSIADYQYVIDFDTDSLKLLIGVNDTITGSNDLFQAQIYLADTLESLIDKWRGDRVPPEYLTFDFTCDEFEGRVRFDGISGNRKKGKIRLTNLEARVLVRRH